MCSTRARRVAQARPLCPGRPALTLPQPDPVREVGRMGRGGRQGRGGGGRGPGSLFRAKASGTRAYLFPDEKVFPKY